ncbi:hypothetical protein [Endozoicomonas montiporae]|nr:hypothetical protein [Endozoicomonas montiporae]AMO58667.1 hypothetical protein EZMO1_4766 [Endozoicomonas montiporae CL-33]
MNASDIEQKLKQSYLDLSKAHQKQDWQVLAGLETAAREVISEVADSKVALTRKSQKLLDDLQQLYKEIIQTCQQERSQLQKQIVEGHKRQKALSAYLSQQEQNSSD